MRLIIIRNVFNLVACSYFHKSSVVMGIHGLSKLIGDVAPNATKENEFKNYFG